AATARASVSWTASSAASAVPSERTARRCRPGRSGSRLAATASDSCPVCTALSVTLGPCRRLVTGAGRNARVAVELARRGSRAQARSVKMAAARQYKTLARLILTVAAAVPLTTCSEHAPTQPGNIGGPSFAIVIVSPNPQTGQVGSTLPPLQVTVTNGNGKGKLLGEVVNFVVTGGGGSVFAPTVVTDLTTGIAQEVWTLGPVAGPQSVEARLIDPGTGNPLSVATFTATATVAPAALISAQAGNGQTAAAGSALPIAPAVLVT